MATKSWSRSLAWQMLGVESSVIRGAAPPKTGRLGSDGNASAVASGAGISSGSIANESTLRLLACRLLS